MMEGEHTRTTDFYLPEDVADITLLSSGIDDVQFEYADGHGVPRTPAKKQAVKHLSNVETPFKLRAVRREEGKREEKRVRPEIGKIEDKENIWTNKEKDIFEDGNATEKWFQTKKAGRKNRAKIYTDVPEGVWRWSPCCKKRLYFPKHFSVSGCIYSSRASLVYLAKRIPCTEDSEGDLVDLDAHVFGETAQLIAIPSETDETHSIVKVTRARFTTRRNRKDKLKEVQFLWTLRKTKNIVKIYRSWEEGGLLFIETELCNMGSLKDQMKSPLWKESMGMGKKALLVEIASAVRAIHKSRIVHLDLKPENIFLHKGQDGKVVVKIGDFGISRRESDKMEIDCDGDKFYMAPELLNNLCSYKSDIYSLGLVFVEIMFDLARPIKSFEWTRLEHRRVSVLPGDLEESQRTAYNYFKKMISREPQERPGIWEVLLFVKSMPT
jgi:Protein kinase domain